MAYYLRIKISLELFKRKIKWLMKSKGGKNWDYTEAHEDLQSPPLNSLQSALLSLLSLAPTLF